MRIVAGVARGRLIAVPRGTATRPTTDRVREAMFSSLTTRLMGHAETDIDNPWRGLRVVDLFAGSGALGLEALSRGAATAVFVERDRRTAALIQRNIVDLGLDHVGPQDTRVMAEDVQAWLHAQSGTGDIDVVFADPPYALATDLIRPLMRRLASGALCRPGALIVVERETRQAQQPWDDDAGIESLDRRTYGETTLWYGRLASLTDTAA